MLRWASTALKPGAWGLCPGIGLCVLWAAVWGFLPSWWLGPKVGEGLEERIFHQLVCFPNACHSGAGPGVWNFIHIEGNWPRSPRASGRQFHCPRVRMCLSCIQR